MVQARITHVWNPTATSIEKATYWLNHSPQCHFRGSLATYVCALVFYFR